MDDPAKLQSLMNGLDDLSKRLPIVFPVHPRTRKNLGAGLAHNSTLTLCDPLGYLEFLSLMAGARVMITDSGGIQEETTALGIPCLTMRHNTERPITVEVGTNTLVEEESDKLQGLLADILAGRYKSGSVPHLWGRPGQPLGRGAPCRRDSVSCQSLRCVLRP